MPNLPAPVRPLDEHQCLKAARVELAFSHLCFDRVLRRDIRGLSPWKHRDLCIAVSELQVLKRLQLWPEVTVAVVDPAVVDAAALVDRDVRVVERGELVEVLRVERGVIAFQPGLDGRDVP